MSKPKTNPVPEVVRCLLLSWLTAVLVELCLLPAALRDLSKLDGLAGMSLPRILGITLGLTAVQIFLLRWTVTSRIQRWCLAAVFILLASVELAASFTWAFFAVCVLVLVILILYAVFGWDRRQEPEPGEKAGKTPYPYITAGLALLFFLFVGAWTACRVWSFSAPSYDFGIFAQMFHHMKQSGLPMTTLERDGLLSHFAVHVSPVYYLMLPFYCIAPTPVTLQILQAAVLASSAIPMWLIGKHHDLTPLQRTALCAALLLYPALSGGTGYDLHENCFLTPLILWLFYGIDRKHTAVTLLAALLTLTVKEDAAVYVAVIAVWLLVKTALRFQKSSIRELIVGGLLLCLSVGWFLLVTGYLATQGDGVMTYRYQNFLYDGSKSLFTVIKAVLLNPMKAVYECVDPEKLRFLALTMLPLLGLPLLTRRYERYLLLIPYVLVNLMPDYQYQHDIFFQYTFGSTACLLYLTAVNLADLKSSHRLVCLAGAVAIGAACFGAVIVPTAVYYPALTVKYSAYYGNVRAALDTVPADASVAATTFYTTRLSQRDILYDVRYCSKAHLLEAEYVVLNVSAKGDFKRYATAGKDNGFENLVALLEDNGYTLFHSLENVLVIYRKG